MPSEQQRREGDTLKDRFRNLRRALGLTQAEVGTAVGVKRLKVLAIEKGRDKCQEHRLRMNLAQVFGVPVVVLDSYLDGELSLADVLAARAETAKAA